MTTKEIKALFPITVQVTDNHKDIAKEQGGLHKLGGLLLKENLPEILHEDIFWGLSQGSVKGVLLKTCYFETIKGKGLVELPLYIDSNFVGNEVKFEMR